MGERLLVIGGDPSGMAAAVQARTDGPHLEIVALVPGLSPGYDAGAATALLRGTLRSARQLVTPSAERLRAMRIDLRTDHQLIGMDLERRYAEVRNVVHGRTFRLGFDLLHLATGTLAPRAEWPGADSHHVHAAGSVEDLDQFVTEVAERKASHVVVIGSGFSAAGAAAALAERGLSVALITPKAALSPEVDEEFGAVLVKALRLCGVDVRLAEAVEEADDSTVCTSAGRVPADLVLLAGEGEPAVSVASAAGIAVGTSGGIKVDRQQRTSAEAVWAAGRCTESSHLLWSGDRAALGALAATGGSVAATAPGTGGSGAAAPGGIVTVAEPGVAAVQGRVAGINIAGGYSTFPGVLATATCRLGASEFGRTGLSEAQAELAGFAHVSASSSTGGSPGVGGTSSAQGEEAGWCKVKLLAEKRTGLLLGAQVASERGLAGELNLAIAAITARLDVEALATMDLVSRGFDPPGLLQDAARQLFDSLR